MVWGGSQGSARDEVSSLPPAAPFTPRFSGICRRLSYRSIFPFPISSKVTFPVSRPSLVSVKQTSCQDIAYAAVRQTFSILILRKTIYISHQAHRPSASLGADPQNSSGGPRCWWRAFGLGKRGCPVHCALLLQPFKGHLPAAAAAVARPPLLHSSSVGPLRGFSPREMGLEDGIEPEAVHPSPGHPGWESRSPPRELSPRPQGKGRESWGRGRGSAPKRLLGGTSGTRVKQGPGMDQLGTLQPRIGWG